MNGIMSRNYKILMEIQLQYYLLNKRFFLQNGGSMNRLLLITKETQLHIY